MSKLNVVLLLGCICLIGVVLYLCDVGARHRQDNAAPQTRTSAAATETRRPPPPAPPQPRQASTPTTTIVSTPIDPAKEAPATLERDLPDMESMTLEQVGPHLKLLIAKQLSARKEYEALKRVLTEIESKRRRKEVEMGGLAPDRQDAEQSALVALETQENNAQAELLEFEARLTTLGATIAQLEARKTTLEVPSKKEARISSRQEQEEVNRKRTLQSSLRHDQSELQRCTARAARLKGDVEGHEKELRTQQTQLSRLLRTPVRPGGEYETQEDKGEVVRRTQERRAQIVRNKNRSQSELNEYQDRIKGLEKKIAQMEAELAVED